MPSRAVTGTRGIRLDRGSRRYRQPTTTFRASEYDGSAPIDEGTLVIGVTQSGETADTLSALREANRAGTETLSVTNVVGSSASRVTDRVMYIRAGPEIGVAATKTSATQQVALAMLSNALTDECSREFVESLRAIPDLLQSVLDNLRAKEIADEYVNADAYFFIGRGYQAPVALEGALKMKEITYKHAEGFPAGELKHGPLALVTEQTPVFALITGDSNAQKTLGNVKEVASRGAPIIAITDTPTFVENHVDHVLRIPETHYQLASVLSNVQLRSPTGWRITSAGRSTNRET